MTIYSHAFSRLPERPCASIEYTFDATFTRDWMLECKAGQPHFKATRRLNDAHQIEEVGAKLRAMMPWIKAKALVDKSRN